MNKHNLGYGICGAKNIYSSQVKLDNWVEDRIGGDLKANYDAPKKHLYETNTMRSYGPPDMNLLASQPVLNIPSTSELKAKNKEGMPYSLLFDHGMREITPDERFTTMSMLTVMKPNEKFTNAQQNKTLERQKSKKMMRDINLSYVKTTEQRMANAHVSYTPQTSDLATGKSADLPNFHRHRPLTITFPQYNQ